MTTTERNDNAVLSGKQASRIIREKIEQAGGSATVTFFQRKKRNITVKNGKIHCTDASYPALSFELFDEIVGFLHKSGGKAEKGSGRDRVGQKKCKEGTVSYCIATSRLGMAKKPGEFALTPISLVTAVLEWAGIARNMKGYLELI